MSKQLRFGKRFSNTGLGETPTISELYGLNNVSRHRAAHYQRIKDALKERALKGDKKAEYLYKKLMLASYGKARSKKPVTKIKLKFLEDKEESDDA